MMGTMLLVTPAHADCKTNEDAPRLMHQADDLRASNLDGAVEKYKEAITLDPDNHRLISKLATAYMKKEDVARGRRHARPRDQALTEERQLSLHTRLGALS